MKASYTKIFDLCNLRLFLFIVLFIISGCQIDQSVSILKEKLFSDTDEQEKEELKTPKSLKHENIETKEASKKKELEQKVEKFKKDQLAIKSMEDRPKIDAKELQKESTETGVLPIKEMGQTRETESKIVSFFSKFFEDYESKDTREKKLSHDSTIKKIKTTSNKDTLRTEENNLPQFYKDSSEVDGNSEVIKRDEIASDNNFTEEKNESEKNSSGYAFLNLKKPEFKEKKLESDNLVGLLLPLTGEKSAAGNLVINSLRYSMLLRPNQLNFKIYDTKGTPRGAVSAAKQGISNNVKTFIGPIFSDETREVQEVFKNKKRLTFFSLSPD